MPQNLNALIRYKQIDSCLRNPYLKATIEILQRKCTEQLEEHRGLYKLVSERTIRDDIRVMRSSALGFNAPIVVSQGVYFYEDSNYSIFNVKVIDLELLKTITQLLVKEKKHIKNHELLLMIARLVELTGVEDIVVKEKPGNKNYEIKPIDIEVSPNSKEVILNISQYCIRDPRRDKEKEAMHVEQLEEWSRVKYLGSISKTPERSLFVWSDFFTRL